MKLIRTIFARNRALAWTGILFLLCSIALAVAIPFNNTEVLGINSLLKPLKFSFSLTVFIWSMAYILHYVEDKKLVYRLSIVIIVTLIFEQLVITIQALRGTLSHFNVSTPIESMLFSLMGVFITTMTLFILFTNFKFLKQKDKLSPAMKLSIFWGINIFVIAGLMGGVMGSLLSHNVGGVMGGASLPVFNWSTEYGDLRVGHFIGLHALQIIPLVGFYIHRKVGDSHKAKYLVIGFVMFYFLIVSLAFVQAFLGLPLIVK